MDIDTAKARTTNSAQIQIAPHPVRVGDKVVRDTATHNQGKVHLGDDAPVFGR